MARKVILAAIVATFIIFVAASIAMANPHQDYATTTNKCKMCHKVHEAPGTYKLLNATNAENACDYCHAPGGQGSQVHVYTISNPVADHAKGASLAGAPVRSKSLTGYLYCFTCHSTHGANTIQGIGNILKVDPAGDGGTAANANQFCADCHDKAMSNPYTHAMVQASGQKAWIGSSECSSCHAEPGEAAGDYPHTSSSHEFLGLGRDNTTVTANTLDNNCLKCHWNAAGTAGVGKTY